MRCPRCESRDLDLAGNAPDGRRRIRCETCAHEWIHGEELRASVARAPLKSTFGQAQARFETAAIATPDRLTRVESLRAIFLERTPSSPPDVAEFRTRYRRAFSKDGLAQSDPQLFKDFANSNVGANPGNMSVFNDAWNAMGPEAGAQHVRDAVNYLLHEDDRGPIEDRLTYLIDPKCQVGIKGFKEALLTKVLCMAYPDRFLPIVKYTGAAGKREIASAVFGLTLPAPDSVTVTIGRLIVWSNDRIVSLLGDHFEDMEHAAAFLWWAKDQPRPHAT